MMNTPETKDRNLTKDETLLLERVNINLAEVISTAKDLYPNQLEALTSARRRIVAVLDANRHVFGVKGY